VVVVSSLLGPRLADPAVQYVVTVPGSCGPWVALFAEFIISFCMMATVLISSDHPRLRRYTGVFVGVLLMIYVTVEAPFSGMSMNPARSFGSGLAAHIWIGFWVYLTAPTLGMLAAGEIYLWRKKSRIGKRRDMRRGNSTRSLSTGAQRGSVA